MSFIEQTAIGIIKGKAKDVRVFSFLAYSLLRKEDWEGFADVFEGLARLAQNNFDALQPDRVYAKELAFKWLSEERFRGTLTDKVPSQADYDHVARLVGALESLKSILEQKFPQNSPFPTELFRSAQSWEKSCKPKPVTAMSAASFPEPQGGETSASSPGGEPERVETPKQAQASARKGALFLIEKEPQKSMGYRLLRCLRWDILEKAPPAEGEKTQLQGPPRQQREYFQNLMAQQEWKTAIEKAEAVFAAASNHLWIDLQRIIVRSCEKLGEPYAAPCAAVLFETGHLIRRIPDIVTLQFSDGTPFCDGETKQWIATEVQPQSAAGVPAATAPFFDRFDEVRQEASALAAAGKTAEAVDLVQESIQRSNGERETFRRSIFVAELFLGAKQPDMAVSVLEMLDRKADAFNLEKWDPGLAIEAWTALVQAYRSAGNGKPQTIQTTLQEKQYSILTKISYIDPKKAVTLVT